MTHANRSENKSDSAKEFIEHCEIEHEKRASSGESFDEDIFKSAVDLVLSKLRHLEGQA
ncbi:hypothetical protein CCP3SC1AL1_560005 [Gammaproteobacteria bacterium]